MPLDRVEDAVAAFARGETIVVVDDEDRENEGDLIVAAEKATPEAMAFMVRHTSGIVCAPMDEAMASRLELPPMVASNQALQGTAFTVSIDYRHGLTTGISAEERTATVRALANGNAGATDFVRPGHIFPLIAKAGGVLARSGHTEAAIDLARLAGLTPVGALAEIVNDDGTVKRLPGLIDFAREHKLRMVSIADLIAYRRRSERLVRRVAELPYAGELGDGQAFVYESPDQPAQHLAVMIGRPGNQDPFPARIEHEDVLAHALGAQGCADAGQFRRAAELIARRGQGVVIYLRGTTARRAAEETAVALTAAERRRQAEWRDVGVGAQILLDLGIRRIELLSGSAKRYIGLDGYGIEIVRATPLG